MIFLVARQTFGSRLRLDSKANVRCKSYSRILVLPVFLMVLTFARNLAARESKCQNPIPTARTRIYPAACRRVSVLLRIVTSSSAAEG